MSELSRVNHLTCTSKQPLQPIPIPSRPFEAIQMDLVGPLPKTAVSNQYLLVVVCLFTRFPEAIPIKDKSAKTVAEALLEHFIPRYGCAKFWSSDQGSEFMNNILDEIRTLLSIQHRVSTARLHSSIGLTERFNKTLVTMIRHYAQHDFGDFPTWDLHINKLLFAYRTSVVPSINESPFYLVYGYDPLTVTDRFLAVDKDVYSDHTTFVEYITSKFRFAWSVAKEFLKDAKESVRVHGRTRDSQHVRPVMWFSTSRGKSDDSRCRRMSETI